MTPPFFAGPGAVARNREAARWAEDLGYDDLWLADAGGVDALTLAASMLECTERLRVGIAVVPAYTRTPAVLAATVAALDDIAPGRFVLGIGSSSEAMIEGWHGLELDRPLTRVRETLELLRTMLAGEKTMFAGDTLRSHGYRQPAVAGDVRIFLAALRPRMLALAAGAGDGVILNLFPLTVLPRLIDIVHDAARAAGRKPEVAARIQVLVTDDVAAGRDAFRFQFAPYFANPVYNSFLAWSGYEAQARALRAAARAGDWRRARTALSDGLVDEIAIIGSAAACQERLRAFIDGGIATPILYCLSDEPQGQRATFTAFSPEQFTP